MKGMVIQNMKKTFHRIGAFVLSAMMVLGLMATPVFADTPSGGSPADTTKTLTIKNAVKDETYKIYSLLRLTGKPDVDGNGGYRYEFTADGDLKTAMMGLVGPDGKFNLAKKQFVDVDTGLSGGFELYDNNGSSNVVLFRVEQTDSDKTPYASDQAAYDKWKATGTGTKFFAAFSDELSKIAENAAEGSDVKPLDVTGVFNDTAKTMTFTGLTDGYYMVVSTAGRRSMTFTVPGENNGNMEIYEKNDVPTVTKKALEDATNEYAENTDKAIGDTVKFRVEIDAGSGLKELKFKDTIPAGMTFGKLMQINFYPRKDDGKVTAQEGATNREVFENSNGGTSASDAISLLPVGASLTAVENTTAKAYKDEKLYAKVDGQSFTVQFYQEWLQSKRMDDTWNAKPSKDHTQYMKPPIYKDDDRLTGAGAPTYGDLDRSGAMYNHYLGDMSTTADDGGIIEIIYTATINENAVTDNVNTAELLYNNDPKVEDAYDENTPDEDWPKTSTESVTHTYTYGLDILKYALGNKGTKLEHAKFKLYRAGKSETYETATQDTKTLQVVTAGTTFAFPEAIIAGDTLTVNKTKMDAINFGAELKFIKDNDTGVYKLAKDQSMMEGFVTELETDSDGSIKIFGLDSDLYKLEETAAPEGYIKADGVFYAIIGNVSSGKTVVGTDSIDQETYVEGEHTNTDYVFMKAAFKDGTKNVDNTEKVYEAVAIANASGMVMPSTGGIGTTIFYVTGGILVLAAGALIIMKKRTQNRED